MAEIAAADPWSGDLAPRVRPQRIEKQWRHDRDPNRRRATFGVLYPVWEITIEKTEDLRTNLPIRSESTNRRSLRGVRLHVVAPYITFKDTDFHECKFHRPDEHGESTVLGLTFKHSNFDRCMFGGTSFRQVTFEACTFSRCDFGSSKFVEDQFLDCKFDECTGENTSFQTTEVDPTAFLAGFLPPLYNYKDPIPDWEETPSQIAEEWVEVRRKVAAQLLRSNVEIHNTRHVDEGIFELKRAEIRAGTKALRNHPFDGGWYRLPFRAGQLLVAWLILHATKGGTSLARLFLGGFLIVSAYALLLSISHVSFMNHDCHLHSFTVPLLVEQFARAASLFLAIGYTAFSGGGRATILLTVGAVVGLFWYALVGAVVIHRVYR